MQSAQILCAEANRLRAARGVVELLLKVVAFDKGCDEQVRYIYDARPIRLNADVVVTCGQSHAGRPAHRIQSADVETE